MKESVIYQDILQQGEAKGLKQGLQQGLTQGEAKGLQKGLKQGLTQGEMGKAEKIALKMLQNNFSLEDVAEFTELSLEQIQALQRRLAQEESHD